jgi:hypothetical protein
MAGVAQRNKSPGLAPLLWDPQNKISASSAFIKPLIAAELAYKLIVIDLD